MAQSYAWGEVDVSEWEPVTDAEVAMRDALRTDDQESYFRILAGVDLLLPVSADALAGLAPLGWGTWSTGGRTHVLAFTSQEALRACLSDYTGSSRRVPYAELANTWPNLEWWLAVNPGLPIEGYLPAWFVAQLARGDLRLPTRGPGREVHGTSKIQELGAAALAAKRAGEGSGGPTHEPAGASSVPGGAPQPGAVPAGVGPGELPQRGAPQPPQPPQPGAVPPGPGPAGLPQRGAPQPASARYGAGRPSGPDASPSGPGSAPASPPFGPGSAPASPPFGPSGAPGSSQFGPGSESGPSQVGPGGAPGSSSFGPGGTPPAPAAQPGGLPGSGLPVRPAGLPTRSTTASGLPVRTPSAADPSGQPAAPAPAASMSGPLAPPAPAAPGRPGAEQVPAAYQSPAVPRDFPGSPGAPAASPALPTRTPAGSGTATPGWNSDALPFGPENDPRGPLQDLNAPLPVRTPMANTPPIPEHVKPYDPAEAQVDPGWAAIGSGRGPNIGAPVAPSSAPASPVPAPAPLSLPANGSPAGAGINPPPARGGSDLPRRQPGQAAGPSQTTSFSGFTNARTMPGSAAAPSFPQGPASPQAAAAQAAPASGAPASGAPAPGASPAGAPPAAASSVGAPTGPGGLPRRQVTPPSERPSSMAAAAQALTGGRTPAPDPKLAQRDPSADRFGPSGPAPALPRSDSGPAGGDRPAPGGRPGLLPPVIPGAFGADRGAGAAAYGAPASGAPAPGSPAYGQGSAAPAYGAAASASGFGPAGSGPAGPVSSAPGSGAPGLGPGGPGFGPGASGAPAGLPGSPSVPGGFPEGRPVSAPAAPGVPTSGAAAPGAAASAFAAPGSPAGALTGSGAPVYSGPASAYAGSGGQGGGYGTNGGPSAYAPSGYSAPAVPGPAVGMPPQGSPASAYANQAHVTQVIQLPTATPAAPTSGSSGLGVTGSSTGGGPGGRDRGHENFVPANETERELQDAADAGNTDVFLSTLLLANVLVPVAHHSRPGSAPGESGFAFQPEEVGGEKFLIVFTSKDRLSEHFGEPTRTVGARFYELIRNWPDPNWSFAVNPGTPVGAKYPGTQIIALANWATEAGLGADPIESPAAEESAATVPAPEPVNDEAQHATVMQKTIAAGQIDYYLDRGYDRVAGFVHRASEVEHLRTPAELFGALGLNYEGSPFHADAKEAFVLRWPAFRPSLYRIPYGGQNDQALRAMDGWVIERPPFRGNGFAPGEGRDVIAEFKVDSVRLPHGAQLWRMDADANERMVAIFDADGPLWRRVGEQ
ncbi:SseB family protein [Actinoplanes sp. NPDC020271]|uniref:SseB family protein n=1 Tax=Actinoplanes sp. NPDC020271 TaxID=3363896 RepID=UPI0037B95078